MKNYVFLNFLLNLTAGRFRSCTIGINWLSTAMVISFFPSLVVALGYRKKSGERYARIVQEEDDDNDDS